MEMSAEERVKIFIDEYIRLVTNNKDSPEALVRLSSTMEKDIQRVIKGLPEGKKILAKTIVDGMVIQTRFFAQNFGMQSVSSTLRSSLAEEL
ncbi:MAG: hypothetical protein FWC68_03950, partial [Oscillospiraceae bacterium]|nr:hypothetical protein [Oscillospiraceae bacterium]